MLRVGEARHPGPDPVEEWTLGVCNPSGLHGKFHMLNTVQADVLTMSETHLTAPGRRNLQTSLRSMHSKYRNVLTGAPMAPRSQASEAGMWAGVGFASTVACRTVATNWPDDLYQTGRIQFAAFHVSAPWTVGAVVYGYPEGKTHPMALQRTEAMLDFALQRLSMTPGPRFLAGDFNFEPEALNVTNDLRAKGWVEIQDLHHYRTGAPIQLTCKGVTRKDHLWISPELALAFTGLDICHETFADHSVLRAHFSRRSSRLERFVWPCPKAVPWTHVRPLETAVSFAEPADPTEQYSSLWKAKEELAKQDVGHEWLPSMQGRAQQVQPLRQCTKQAPIRQGRSSDVQPAFFGYSAMHAKQFKQLRRLQNFCRWIDGRSIDRQDNLHGIGLWNSILRAPGFWPSFPEWWLSRQYVSPLDPATIPQFCPDSVVAHQIYDAVYAEVRSLETKLLRAKTAHWSNRHASDKHLIFREVARCPAEPVESLLHAVHAKVEWVDTAESALVLTAPAALKPDLPLWVNGVPTEVIHSEHDKVWVTDTEHAQPGQPVVQTQHLGDLPAIFEAFHEQWKLRWCRHDGTPFNRWNTLLDFAKQVLPCHTIPHLQVDVPTLQAEFHRKKKTAATGLDGVSRADWIAADEPTLQSLLSAFTRAETDGMWPRQLLAGKVHSLAKTESASAVGDYRPITVFGLAYRAWSSLHARHLLLHADQWADDGVYGNRPGRQAADLWHHVMLQVEQAYSSGVSLSGLSADIEKCFNCIPRYPALCLAVLVGTPHQVTTAWAGALSSMCRHFKVRESFSSGFATSTGLAEGCGLSVYGMLLIDHLFALWLKHQAPAVQSLSYVDAWDTNFAVKQLELVEGYAGLLDLTVDRRKTFGWATDSRTRAQLRASGIRVLHQARELGGHLGISRQHTNHTLTQRLAELEDFWGKLKASKAKYHTKVHVLRAVAWPRGLHGVSSAPVGDSVWTDLRRRAISALGCQRPGTNSHVVLGLIESLVDPQLVGLLWTCRAVRQQCDATFWTSAVALVSLGELDLPPNSLASIVASRLRQVGIQVDRDGTVLDSFGRFSLHDHNYAEVELRLQWAWHRVVAQRVSHRAEFGGLWQVDTFATRKALAGMPADDQALYRHGLSGGLYTESYKAKWTEQSDACRWCGQTDTLHHRFWECPQHQDLRDAVALPPALALRGWALLPVTWHDWITLLGQLPSAPPDPACGLRPGQWNDVFTDGSCIAPSSPYYRLAAWSAVCAPSFGPNWTVQGAPVLGASYLPGICQTAYRAELYAIAFSLHCAACARAPIRLWSDCLGVVTRLNQLLKGHCKVSVNKTNSDLWQWVLRSVEVLGRQQVRVYKVPAHQQLRAARSQKEAWRCFYNAMADRAARCANQSRPSQFWDFWEKHVQATFAADALCTQVRNLHLAIGRRNVRGGLEHEDAPAASPRATRDFPVAFELGPWRGEALPAVSRLFGTAHLQRATKWFWERLDTDPTAEVVWVSFTQLYVDYQLTWGNPGPLRVNGHWVDTASRQYLDAEKYHFKQRVKWFRQFLKKLWLEAKVDVSLAQCKPRSECLQAYLPSVALPWSSRALFEVEKWLTANLSAPCVRDAAILKSLPLINQCDVMLLEAVH